MTSFLTLKNTMDRQVAEGPQPDSAYTLLNLVGQPSTQQFPLRSYVLVPVDGAGNEAVKAAVEQAPLGKRLLWFVFSGMGCRWSGMARQVLQFDVFAHSLYESHNLLKQFGIDLIDAVSRDTAENSVALNVASITAIQVALVDLLPAVGVKPDGMVGHWLGESACAYVDECFTAEQAVLCSYWRGRCSELGDLPKGAMAAIGPTWQEAGKRCGDGVVPACHNAQDSVTVSVPADAVATLVQELQAENVFARKVDSGGVAFHSDHMLSVGPPLLGRLREVVPAPKARSRCWISTSLPEDRWQEPLVRMSSAEYHVNNVLAPVLFSEAVQHVPKDAVVIDIGPHCLMLVLDRIKLHGNLEDKKYSAVDVLLELNPDLRARRNDVSVAVNALLELRKAGMSYRREHKFHGDITLIKASTSLISGRHLPADYGASDCCTGKVYIRVVDGSHASLIVGKSAQKCAAIINQVAQKRN